jgi:hypothetical protein
MILSGFDSFQKDEPKGRFLEAYQPSGRRIDESGQHPPSPPH